MDRILGHKVYWRKRPDRWPCYIRMKGRRVNVAGSPSGAAVCLMFYEAGQDVPSTVAFGSITSPLDGVKPGGTVSGSIDLPPAFLSKSL